LRLGDAEEVQGPPEGTRLGEKSDRGLFDFGRSGKGGEKGAKEGIHQINRKGRTRFRRSRESMGKGRGKERG